MQLPDHCGLKRDSPILNVIDMPNPFTRKIFHKALYVVVPVTLVLIVWAMHYSSTLRSDVLARLNKPITSTVKVTVLDLHGGQDGPTVEIDSPKQISLIGQMINERESFYPNHPTTKWKALLSFDVGGENVEVLVTQTTEFGTLLYVFSGGDQGVLFGTYRVEGLGHLIESQMAITKANPR